MGHGVQHVQGLGAAVQVEAGHVHGVDHFHHQADAVLGQGLGGKAQIGHQGVAHQHRIGIGGSAAGQAIEARHLQCAGVGDGLGHAVAKFFRAVGVARNAPVTGIPIAGG